MARFQLFLFNGGYVLDLQTDVFDIPGSRIVAPVLPERDAPKATASLHPRLMVDGKAHVLAVHLLAATPIAMLKGPVGHFADQADEITRALDILFQGY